ncbi:MAG TPA: SusD/RagB family nutrient-binding outer membrane lipoprotein, partial [Gemmatimonadales bacterium]|nr:SusD/RagB family nutrient-binding outer membrane lipoprotein [Gemmatimonadales bacterium]
QKALLGLGLALGAAGCSNYLSAPDVTNDPTKVTVLTKPGPLYIGVQEAGPPEREGQLARFAAEYTQQVAGFSRQQIGYDTYNAKPSDTDPYFTAIYGVNNTLNGGGGLLDIHKMQQLGHKVNDSLYIGIGKVYEALYMGLAADMFGDIPYREAADSTILAPHFDPQLQIYADLQTQLDSAITIFLAATGPTNAGGSADGSELIYGGRSAAQLRTVYTEVAHSLKARLYMHTAETDPTAYAKALAEVPLGISSPADDFLWFHDGTPQGQNIWWQFGAARGDVAPAAALVEILKRRIAAGVEDSLRLKFYFTPATGGGYFGYRPGATTNVPVTGAIDPGNGNATGQYSGVGTFIDGLTPPGDFRQPEITYAETQLIGAEAALQTGNAAAAQTFLNAARTNRFYGSTGGAAVGFGSAPGVLPATLQNIIEEKYVTLFLNPEVWNDYKRTCFPSLAPAPSTTAPGTAPRNTPIPGRVPYGLSEINANPNTPATSSTGVAISTTSQNPNDPTACPVLNYTSSVPLAN